MYTLWQAKEILRNSLVRKESTSLLPKSSYYSGGGKTCNNLWEEMCSFQFTFVKFMKLQRTRGYECFIQNFNDIWLNCKRRIPMCRKNIF